MVTIGCNIVDGQGAGAGIIGAGIGSLVADYLNGYRPGLGYFAIFGGYGLLFLLSTLSLRWVKMGLEEERVEFPEGTVFEPERAEFNRMSRRKGS